MLILAIILSGYAALMAGGIVRGVCRKPAVIMCVLASMSAFALWTQAAGWLAGILTFALIFAGGSAFSARWLTRISPPSQQG